MPPGGANGGGVRALVVHPHLKSESGALREPQARLDEAVGLAAAISLVVVGAEVVRLPRIRPASFFGQGIVDSVAGQVDELCAGVVIADCALTPVQQRNLERAWKCKVIDRTGLILEIFGERARTKEGQLQVELAHLSYQRSRLVRSWTHLERQRGGFGFLGGPGETQIEADRRQIGQRIARLKELLGQVTRTRRLHRAARRRVPYPVVALVGYTNAGKSTLFNRLTRAEVMAKDLLFATLDPTLRALDLPSGRRVILSDTVGFVSDLPTDLVAAFRATLEEVTEADLIIHVRDVSHPDSAAQDADVRAVLSDLGVLSDDGVAVTPMIEALNKIDQLDDEARRALATQSARRGGVAMVSARTGEGCPGLLDLIDRSFNDTRHVVDLDIDASDGAMIAWLYRRGNVLSRSDEGERIHLKVGLDPADLDRLARKSGATV